MMLGLDAAGLAACAAGAAPRSAHSAAPIGLPGARQLQAWTGFMANLGPRYARNSHHRLYVDFLAHEFAALGLKPKRDRQSFEGWEAVRAAAF
jgi:hypothetical protein